LYCITDAVITPDSEYRIMPKLAMDRHHHAPFRAQVPSLAAPAAVGPHIPAPRVPEQMASISGHDLAELEDPSLPWIRITPGCCGPRGKCGRQTPRQPCCATRQDGSR